MSYVEQYQNGMRRQNALINYAIEIGCIVVHDEIMTQTPEQDALLDAYIEKMNEKRDDLRQQIKNQGDC